MHPGALAWLPRPQGTPGSKGESFLNKCVIIVSLEGVLMLQEQCRKGQTSQLPCECMCCPELQSCSAWVEVAHDGVQREAAAVVVQAAWRALRVRAELMEQRRAAILIQVTAYRTILRLTACAHLRLPSDTPCKATAASDRARRRAQTLVITD